MAKQLNVRLSVDADVKQAKAAFEQLQKTLTNIQSSAMTSSKNLFNVKEIKAASEAARELQQHLAAATDANTGRLNLSTFSNSLKTAGKDLSTYKLQLESLGPSGEQAFTQIAKSIAMADNPLRRTNGLLQEFRTTLVNTARWQISSSILHGFMGAVQSAYGYAQDLNESLNNIRIVTGLNTDQMAKFADEANKAAKALSTTTLHYTDAALIYYQQGLTGKDVTDRVNTTIKLANVSRQNAEEVSSQMTAIWNNFYDGSKSLEYYADVITALGAATASSSDEIAQGLQKFAAVADTVGLSYEKATAALATVVAETRQSADVVGTAFKTMFARFQGVTLGETLEDGVGLNKYSQALATVGVNILEANGNLKDMDTILDELGAKWNQIGNAQQVALAETVAGTRQYAQFMAIMENYDKILANQKLGAGAEGTLQKQADIYAESWEAASKRVKAALETIYDNLINDKFFIGVNNVIADLLDGVNGFIKGLGGVKGILSTVGALITQSLAKEAPVALSRINEFLTQISGKAQQIGSSMQSQIQDWAAVESNSALSEFRSFDTAGPNATEYMAEVNIIELLAEKKRQYNQYEAQYNSEQKKRAQDEIASLEAVGAALTKKGAALDSLREKVDKMSESLNHMAQDAEDGAKAFDSIDRLKSAGKVSGQIANLSEQLSTLNSRYKEGKFTEEEYKSELEKIGMAAKSASDELGGEFEQNIKLTQEALQESSLDAEGYANCLSFDLSHGAQQAEEEIQELTETLHTMHNIPTNAIKNYVEQLKNMGYSSEEIVVKLDNMKKSFGDLQPPLSKTSSQIMSLAGALMQFNAVLSSITRIKDVFNDEDATTLEKIGALIGGLTTLIFAYNAISKVMISIKTAEKASLFGATAGWIAEKAGIDLVNASLSTTIALTGAVLAGTALLIGAIYGLITIIQRAREKSPEGQLKKLTKQQEELTKATEDARNEWEQFQNALSEYDKGLEGLEKLTKGTIEFNEELKRVNETAEDIIKSLSLVFGEDYYFNEDGVKVFTDRGQQKIKEGNASVARGAEALNWVGLQQQNKEQKLQYESDYGKTVDEREARAREKTYDDLAKKYTVLRENSTLYQNLYTDIKRSIEKEEIDENYTLEDLAADLKGDQKYKELLNENIDISNLVKDIARTVENVNSIATTPFKTDYNEEAAWVANQLDKDNPFYQKVAQNVFNDEEKIEQLRTNTLADYLNSQTISDEDIEKEWKSLFGLLEDNGKSILEAAGFDNNLDGRRKFLAERKVGQTQLEEAQHNLEILQNQAAVLSSQNRDILTGMLGGSIKNISPEDIYRLKENGLSQNDKTMFDMMYKRLYPNAVQTSEELFNAMLAEYKEADFYRTQVKDIDEVRESIKNYNKELKSLKLGDTIKPEIYKDLSEGAKTYFQLMEDGTYKLVGNAEQLQDILFKETTAEFDENLQNLQKVGETDQLTPEDAAKIQENAISYAMATETLSQLNYVKERFNELGIDAQTQAIAENAALQDLATKYESCTDDLEAYQHALTTNNKDLVEAAKNTLEYSIAVAELSQKHGFDAKQTEAYAKRLKDNLASSMKEAGFSEKQLEKSALAAAIANQRLDRGLLSLNKNLDSYKKSLEQTNKNSIEWSNTMESLKTDLADILDMDISVLTDELAESFLTNSEYSALLTQALDGNVEAIKRLREIAADKMMENIQSSLAAAGEDVTDFMTQWDHLKTMMAEAMQSGGIDQTNLVNSFNELIEKGHMTKEQIEAALAGMHVAADIETEYHPQTIQAPTTITDEQMVVAGYKPVTYYDTDGNEKQRNVPLYRKFTTTYSGEPVEVTGYVPTYKIKGTTGQGTATSKIVNGNAPPKNRQGSSQQSFISDSGESSTPLVTSIGTSQIITDAFSPVTDEAIQASFGSTTTGLKDKDKNKGGGSTKSNTKSVEEHIDEEHRYDELNKQLEGLSKQYDRLGKARDRAWGKNKIALLGQELDKLKQMQKVYERYLQTVAGDNWKNLHDALQSGGNIGALIAAGRAGGYLQKDFDKLISAAKGGIEYKGKNANGEEQLFHIDWQGLKDTFNIDLLLNEFGEIANKDDIEEAIEAWWNNHIDDINELEDGDEKTRQKNELEAIRDYAKKALDQYADSVNTFTENSDKLLDNFYDQQDKFYENFRYKIDLKVEISERSLKRIEYAIKILGDNIYKVPEVMQAWFDERVTNTKDEVEKMGTTWTQAYADATAAHAQGLISDEDYIQTIKDAQDGLYDCIDSLLEINDEMREYYKNVLSKVKDEMARITDEMDHQLDTINHLTNVLSLLGRETDYAAIGKILDAQLQMSRNGYDVSKAQVEMYRRQVEAAQAELEQFIMEGISEEALEEWKNAVLYPAQEALREAESEMEADFEQYLEVIKARYENNINRIYQDSERRLTGRWGSFDELNKAMERQHALDEEYLTKTNQIYETNVLLKKLAQDLDKTNNNAAKTRIKNFSSEIEELQQKNKLSKSELEIAKARYEMLLAENALEDARNAKSTVRLQRDNEGNYGYVYTADSDKITAAEDEFEQKRNDLYNLVLGQANDYTEKIIQLNQQAYSELKELDLAYAEGRIADEDTYNRLRQDIIDKYNDLIQEDYESYYRALGWLDVTASTDHTEAWGTSFADILDLEEDFKGETSQVIQETGAEISELSALRAEATEEAKVGNGELEKQLGELTKANDDLAREMIDRVVPSAEDTLMMAQQLTAEWIRQYSAIMNLVSGYMALATAMNQTMSDMSGVADEGTGGLGFDPDFDYANAMRNWLLNGGSKDDEQYKQWEREREAKIDSMGLSQDYYGYRGDEFQNKLDTYIENDLEGYTIADAVDAFEQAGENLEQVSEQLNQLTSYGTGGFTGNWGSRGKLAVLHEKELVLNPADTENIVSAVGMLREFSSAIDLRAAASNLSGGLNSPNYEPGAQVVEQEVNIHAEFPNVTNHSEIEEAFNSLINRASQYASRY